MRKLEFCEIVGRNSYAVFESNQLVYVVSRWPNGKWVAHDLAGKQVERSDVYRADLFERLKMLPKETHNNG